MSRKPGFQFLAVSLAAFLVTMALRFVNGGRAWVYVENHLGLTALLPLASIFLGLLARNFYLEYKREPTEALSNGDTRNARV